MGSGGERLVGWCADPKPAGPTQESNLTTRPLAFLRRQGYICAARGCRRSGMTLKLNTRLIDGITVVDCHGRIIFGDESLMLREAVKEHLKT